MWIEATALGLSAISPLMISSSSLVTDIAAAAAPAAVGVYIAKQAITTGVAIGIVKIVK